MDLQLSLAVESTFQRLICLLMLLLLKMAIVHIEEVTETHLA